MTKILGDKETYQSQFLRMAKRCELLEAERDEARQDLVNREAQLAWRTDERNALRAALSGLVAAVETYQAKTEAFTPEHHRDDCPGDCVNCLVGDAFLAASDALGKEQG